MQIWLKSIGIDMRSKVRVEGLNFLWPLRWRSWFEWDISRQLSENEWWDGKLLTGRKIILEVTSIHLSLPYLCCSGMFSSERSPRREWDQLAVVRSISVKLSTLAEKKNRRITCSVFGSFQRSGKSVFLFGSFRAGSRRREDDKRSCSLLTVNVTGV